jgi:cytochrome c-type biogenesis protein CcmH
MLRTIGWTGGEQRAGAANVPISSRNADEMGLWIILCLMTVAAAIVVVVPILRARGNAQPANAREIAVYADQLDEVRRDLQRGLIGETELVAARTEIGRRILRADQAGKAAFRADGRSRLFGAILVCLVIPAVSIGLYVDLGSPSLPDQPLAERKTAPIENLSPDELVARLDQQLAANPNDVRGWDIAGPIYMRMGRFADAVNAFQTAIRLGGPDLRRESGLGEALTSSAQGVVTSEARAAFEAAAKLAPESPMPKMYLALALSQDGRLQESADAWKRIIASAPGNEPWAQAARRELQDVESKLAERNGTATAAIAPPATASAPQSAAVSNGEQSMIEGMVSRLQQRLDTRGGTPEDWGRLIKSYLVLGRTDDAKAAYTKAKLAFNTNPTAAAALSSIVTELGLTE